MNVFRLFLVALVLVFSSQFVSAQDELGYRAYSLNMRLDSVLAVSGARKSDVRVLHERPARIEQLEWRVPYGHSSELVDPVRQITFSFCDDALYQVLVSYDPARTDGLSNTEIIESLMPTYGHPVPGSSRNRPLDAASDTVVLAQWDRAGSSLTLLRRVYSAEFQLLLTAKALGTRARGAIREAERLYIADAPRREREQRKQDAAEAIAARDKLRANNKAAFRP